MYVHIGMAKTGTTFFQNIIAKNIKNIKYLGLAENMNIGDIIWGRQGKYLISNEGIAASIVDENSLEEFKRRVTRMKSVFSDTKVIFSVRNHSDLIVSSYLQYQYTKNPGIEINEFFDVRHTKSGVVNYQDVMLSKRIEILKELFGEDLFIFRTRELKEGLKKMLGSLRVFIGESIDDESIINSGRSNVSMNNIDHLLRKKFGGVIKSVSEKLYRNIPKTSEVVPGKWKFNVGSEIKKEIEDMYREDWKRVNELLEQNRREHSAEVGGDE